MENAPEAIIRRAVDIGHERSLHSGETLFNKGDQGDSMYIILDGHIRVHDGDLALNTLSAGHVIGEIGSLGSMQRTADITAEDDVTLFEINCKTLLDSLSNEQGFTKSMIAMLCSRESSMASTVANRSHRVRSLEAELEIGRKIQSYFLPDSIPGIPSWSIETYFKAAHEVAGDFYDAFEIQSLNRIALVMGDVCDKGVGAALFMTLFRSLIRATALSMDFNNWSVNRYKPDQRKFEHDRHDPNRQVDECLLNSLQMTNNYIATTHGKTSMFSSIFFGLLDPDTGNLRYINAGHEAPVIFRENQIVRRLDTTGPVVGIFPSAQFHTGEAHLEYDDYLLIFTDGITEAKSIAGEQFTEKRLLDILTRHHENADMVLTDLLASLGQFTEGVDQFDDNTILLAHRNLLH